MRLVQSIRKGACKMDRLVRQKAYRLFIPRRCLGQSSNERAAIEPSVEVVGGRGRIRSHGLWRRIFTSDEGSPHLERHWRFADALGPCDNREHSEVSRSHNKGRPDHGLSSLRYLTVSVCCVAAQQTTSLVDRPECLGGLQVDDRSVLGRGQHRCRLPLLKSFIRASLQDFFRSGMITLSTQADSTSSTSPKTCASFRPVRAGT
jgi:hypothetical protein